MQEMDLLEREIRFKRELSEGSAQDITSSEYAEQSWFI